MELKLYPILNKDVLLKRKKQTSEEEIVEVSDLLFVKPNEDLTNIGYLQSRSYYGSEKELEELKKSILENGVLEPLIVSREGGSYRVFEGNRRAFALTEILNENNKAKTPSGWSLSSVNVRIIQHPEHIIQKEYKKWFVQQDSESITELQKEECKDHISKQVYAIYNKEALHRNTQRKQWTWCEQMRSCQYRINNGESLNEVARTQNLSSATLKNNLRRFERLQSYPEVLKALNEEKIKKSIAKLFLNVDRSKHQVSIDELLNKAINEGMTADAVNLELEARGIKIQQRIMSLKKKKTKFINFDSYKHLIRFIFNFLQDLNENQRDEIAEVLLTNQKTFTQEFLNEILTDISSSYTSFKEAEK